MAAEIAPTTLATAASTEEQGVEASVELLADGSDNDMSSSSMSSPFDVKAAPRRSDSSNSNSSGKEQQEPLPSPSSSHSSSSGSPRQPAHESIPSIHSSSSPKGSVNATTANTTSVRTITSCFHTPRPSPQEALCCPSWTRVTNALHHWIIRTLVSLSRGAARRPLLVVVWITTLSFVVFCLGLATNYNASMDINLVYAPLSSPPLEYSQWITDGLPDSNHGVGFSNTEVIGVTVLIHANGGNVLTRDITRQAMQVMTTLQSLELYQQVCNNNNNNNNNNIEQSESRYQRSDKCTTYSVTDFWDNSMTTFDAKVQTDADIMQQVATAKIGNTPVSLEGMLGNYHRNNSAHDDNETNNNNNNNKNKNKNNWITWAQAYHMHLHFPARSELAKDLELEIAQKLLDIREQWMVSSSSSASPQLTFLTPQSMELEVLRTTQQDIPLVPFAIVLMTNFTALVFFQRHKIKSRWMLGYGAVTTIALAVMTAFGLLFMVGVPVTTAVMVVPFIVLGIGLDNIFVISGAYFRISRRENEQQQQQQVARVGVPATRRTSSGRIVVEEDSAAMEYEVKRPESPAPGQSQEKVTKNEEEEPVVRLVTETMEDVGMSITLTTSTTIVAFLLASISDIRGIRWLGFYACLCVLVNFLYQVTLFIALLVLDERRINANRRDVCCWSVVPDERSNSGQGSSPPRFELDRIQESESLSVMDASTSMLGKYGLEEGGLSTTDGKVNRSRILTESTVEHDSFGVCSVVPDDDLASSVAGSQIVEVKLDKKHHAKRGSANCESQDENVIEKVMRWYSNNVLLKPWFRCIVLAFFVLYFAACCYSTTLLEQQFKPEDYLPRESYIKDFIDSADNYLSFDRMSATYFRFANQSDPSVQQQMRIFIDDMVATEAVGGVEPAFCWVRDFPKFQEEFGLQDVMQNMTFVQQLDFALSLPAIDALFGGDIVRNPESGEIVASRCWFFLSNLDVSDVNDQLNFYHDQLEVTTSQPINDERSQSVFFTFDYQYFIWAYFSVIVPELVFSLILGVVAVTVIGIIFMPHWTAGLFIFPLIMVCYVDVMGTIQFFGLNINSFTFVCIVISVGLLVDYLFHVLLRYYETPGSRRETKIQNTLQTMGASISIGGISTFLGILPLAFSSSVAMKSVFLSFIAMLFVGIVHGLVVLPVLLSLFGPVNGVSREAKEREASQIQKPAIVVKMMGKDSEV